MIRDFCQRHSKKTAFLTVQNFLLCREVYRSTFSWTGMLNSVLQMFMSSWSSFIQLFKNILFFSYFKFNESL